MKRAIAFFLLFVFATLTITYGQDDPLDGLDFALYEHPPAQPAYFILWFENGNYEADAQGYARYNGKETGVYVATADSVYITITDSTIPGRQGISFAAQLLFDVPVCAYVIGFTNARVLTFNNVDADTVWFWGQTIGIEKTETWYGIKKLFDTGG